MSGKAWTGKTGGTGWMQRTLIGLFRHINPVCMYPIMWVWVLGYICFAPSGTRGIYHYWHSRRGYSPLKAIGYLYLNYVEFGHAILDRFAAWAGRRVNIQFEGIDILHRLTAYDKGFIVLSTHIGNQELAGYNIRMPKPMNVLTYVGDTPTVNVQREKAFAEMCIHIIPVEKDGSHILSMHQALERGEIVSVHGDRMFYGDKVLRATILGEEASFPAGCFQFAALEQLPVVTLFMMRDGLDNYTLYVKQLSDGHYEGQSKQQRALTLLNAYTHAMEEVLQRYPKQWFHFYEFFNQ